MSGRHQLNQHIGLRTPEAQPNQNQRLTICLFPVACEHMSPCVRPKFGLETDVVSVWFTYK